MILRHRCTMLLVLILLVTSASLEDASRTDISNISHMAEKSKSSASESTFSPRMDFEQWKPLTGRGDPLRNDPTYDYEPPVLERVHYWADDTRPGEHYPEKKSEVLMLGISSRRPSIVSRHTINQRRPHRPLAPSSPAPAPMKYEDFTYPLGQHYPMTILVPPPPPPPPSHQSASLYVLPNDKTPPKVKLNVPIETTTLGNFVHSPEHATSLYSLQEANLIYQSSTTSQNWIRDFNHTKPSLENSVSSDYAGWGPTTPLDGNNVANDTYNYIANNNLGTRHPYNFYKPMLSEAPPPPQITSSLMHQSTFLPTALPPTIAMESPTTVISQTFWPTESTTTETVTSNNQDYYENTEEKKTTFEFQPTITSTTPKPNKDLNVFDMLGPMMSMPLVNGPERPQDNLYAHASENLHVFKEKETKNAVELETMQTMQPPPVIESTDVTTMSHNHPFHVNPHTLNSLLDPKKTFTNTHDPYLHMRFTSPMPTTVSPVNALESLKVNTPADAPAVPFLIIQGHSKVKTYGSKPKILDDTISNEIIKTKENNLVKHLHPIKNKVKTHEELGVNRTSRGQNLNFLIANGLGSIEIQETDIGIKYDVSDGSDVPIEVYRKGIVNSDENDYALKKKNLNLKRSKKHVEIEDFLPFNEEKIEEYVYDFFKQRKNDTGLTGFIAQTLTDEHASVIDMLEDDDDDEDKER